MEAMGDVVRAPHKPLVLADFEKTEAPTTRRHRRTPHVAHRPITRSLTRAARMAANSPSFNFSQSPSPPPVDPTFMDQPSEIDPSPQSHPRMRASSRICSHSRRVRPGQSHSHQHATSKRRHATSGSSSPNVDNRNQSCILDATDECPSIHPEQFPPSCISHSQLSSRHVSPRPAPHHATHMQPSPHGRHQSQTSSHIEQHAEPSPHQKDHAPTSPHQKNHAPTSLNQEHAELSPYEVFSMQKRQATFVQSVLHRGVPDVQKNAYQPSKSQQISGIGTNHDSLSDVHLHGTTTSFPHNSSHAHDPSQKHQINSRKRSSPIANEQVAKQMRIAHRKRRVVKSSSPTKELTMPNRKSPVQQAPLPPADVHASQVQQASHSASPRPSVSPEVSTNIQQAPRRASLVQSSAQNQVQHSSHGIHPISRVTQESSPKQPLLHHDRTSMQQAPYHGSPIQTALHYVPLAQQPQEMPLQHVPYRNQYSNDTFYGETSRAASIIPGLRNSPLYMQTDSRLKLQSPQQRVVQRPQHVISAPPTGNPYMGLLQPSSQAAFYNQQPKGPSPDTMRLNNNVSVQRASQYHAQKDSSAFESLPAKQQPSRAALPSSPPPPPPLPSRSHSFTSSPLHRQSDQGDVAADKPPQSNQRRNSGSSSSSLPSLSQSTSLPPSSQSTLLPPSSTSPSPSTSTSTSWSPSTSFHTHDHWHKTPGVQYMHP